MIYGSIKYNKLWALSTMEVLKNTILNFIVMREMFERIDRKYANVWAS